MTDKEQLREALRAIEHHYPDDDCIDFPEAAAERAYRHIEEVKKAAQAHLKLLDEIDGIKDAPEEFLNILNENLDECLA